MGDVLKPPKSTLMLIGNSSNYISKVRRRDIIDNLCQSRPRLAKFLQQVCKDNEMGILDLTCLGPNTRKGSLKRPTPLTLSAKPRPKWTQPHLHRNLTPPPLQVAVFYPIARYRRKTRQGYQPMETPSFQSRALRLHPMVVVPKEGGGWRPIINLKMLSFFLIVRGECLVGEKRTPNSI